MKIASAALWFPLAASVTASILNGFSWPTLVLVAIFMTALGFWLAKHRNELRAKYETAEAAAAIPGPYDKQIWGHKPRLRDLAPGGAIMGIVSFYFAYAAAHGDPPSKIARLIHHFFGVPGVVAFWSVLAVVMLSVAVEAIIGSRVRK